MSVRSFMLDFRSQTRQVTNQCNERFWRDSVIFKVTAHRLWVDLNRISNERHGKGLGSAALDWFCALADKHGIGVRGIVAPFGDAWLSSQQLTDWYARHGFDVLKSATDTYIDRAPCNQRVIAL